MHIDGQLMANKATFSFLDFEYAKENDVKFQPRGFSGKEHGDKISH